MSYPSVDCIINFRKSCSIEDAVAKLLGWLKGPVSHGSIRIDNGPITIEQLEYLDTLVFSLEDHLISLREDALHKLDDAINADASDEVKRPLLDAACDIEDLIERARQFLLDINDELDKKGSSILVMDQAATDETGEVHVTLKSLDRWAKDKYGIAVLEQGLLPVLGGSIKMVPRNADKALHRQQEHAILEVIGQLGEDPKNLPKNPQGKPGIKFKVRDFFINDPLFAGSTVFDKAWERLRKFRDIQDIE